VPSHTRLNPADRALHSQEMVNKK